MRDDNPPWYAWNRRPPAVQFYRPKVTERLWEICKDHIIWSADLRFHGESYGWESMVLRNGELSISQRFLLKAAAIEYANQERAAIEKGWLD